MSDDDGNKIHDPKARFSEPCLYRAGKSLVRNSSIQSERAVISQHSNEMNFQLQGAVGGFVIGSSMLAWYPDPYRFDVKNTVTNYALDARYIMRGLRGPVMWASVVCGTFSLVECTVEQLRDEAKESTWVNSSIAGAAAGMVMGSMTRRLDIVATSALGLGLMMGMVEYNGQTYVSDEEHATTKWDTRLPAKSEESETLKALKEKYPEFKDL